MKLRQKEECIFDFKGKIVELVCWKLLLNEVLIYKCSNHLLYIMGFMIRSSLFNVTFDQGLIIGFLYYAIFHIFHIGIRH